MKVLVLGGNGMAGHMITAYLQEQGGYEVKASVREVSVDPQHAFLDAANEMALKALLYRIRPDVVINAIGLLNETAAARREEAIRINSLLPHRLAAIGDEIGYRLVHLSTDCVFSGTRGGYIETDVPDGTTMYAHTKIVGEVTRAPHVTVRTSIIGPEKKADGSGLFAWFMRQEEVVYGYRNVFWSGVTTLELAKVIRWLLTQSISGLIHLTAPEKISKYELLMLMKEEFDRARPIIHPHDDIISDKSLVNTREDVSYCVPSYQQMMRELKDWCIQHS